MEALILSRGQDTNGQNARYVEAARKHGKDEDVLSVLAVGRDDPAAVVTRYRLAAQKYGHLHIREAHRHNHYFEWPHDMTWGKMVDRCPQHPPKTCQTTDRQLKALANQADVIHLNNSEIAYRLFHLKKPALLHHHGSLFRNNPQYMLDTARRYKMVQAVSTVDLLRFAPDQLTWLPSAYDIDEMQAFAKEHGRKPDGRVRIVHCPTNRELKHTHVLEAAVAELKREGLPVDLEIVEFRPWRESLAAKAKADIVYDQLTWGYGCNGIEAMAMGKPLIAGADDWTIDAMLRQWGVLPFFQTTETDFLHHLRVMVKDKSVRKEYAHRGLGHVRKYHDELPALTKLAELYSEAIDTYYAQRIPGKGNINPEAVTFRKVKSGAVFDLEGNEIAFTDGRITTDDPLVVHRLRTLAKRPARFGIKEGEDVA